ncbi:MAG: 2-oxoacid:acceptor oxidoreductase family protein [Candidatus Aminicenantes bacterium]|nr:2-oxoacid:acceptor oxidoreductase family protein [Candidatus Aminicenantes bacterium]MDH5714007.1 2-oxoacid:acceptor oxidoreductase family protein [Candidatus Aminicenantes bacterium]
MSKVLEIRWHARAGQGAVMAANNLAQVLGELGKYTQAYPEYGAEKRGAPVEAFDRISDSPIRIHSRIEEPQLVLVLDQTLLRTVDVCEGVPPDAIVIINSNRQPDELRQKLNIGERKLYVLDGSKIAIDEIGVDIPNAPMLGALVKVTNLADINSFNEKFRALMGKKFTSKIIEGNLKAAKRGYEEVKQA